MARLTYSAVSNSNAASGPKALGSMIVEFWKNSAGKTAEEIEVLTAELHAGVSDLFVETQSGEVRVEFLKDTDEVVHIALPKPAADLSKYEREGFAEAFGNAIVYGCGRSQPIRTVSTASPTAEVIDFAAGSRKAA